MKTDDLLALIQSVSPRSFVIFLTGLYPSTSYHVEVDNYHDDPVCASQDSRSSCFFSEDWNKDNVIFPCNFLTPDLTPQTSIVVWYRFHLLSGDLHPQTAYHVSVDESFEDITNKIASTRLSLILEGLLYYRESKNRRDWVTIWPYLFISVFWHKTTLFVSMLRRAICCSSF